MAARTASTGSKLFERFYYDLNLYKMFNLERYMTEAQYVAARHNAIIAGGFFAVLNLAFPFNPSFPMMGLCPAGYKGTWVCEPNKDKAMEMYKQWKAEHGK